MNQLLEVARSLAYRKGCKRGRSWLTMEVGHLWAPGIVASFKATQLACEIANVRFYPRRFEAKKLGRKYLIERIG